MNICHGSLLGISFRITLFHLTLTDIEATQKSKSLRSDTAVSITDTTRSPAPLKILPNVLSTAATKTPLVELKRLNSRTDIGSGVLNTSWVMVLTVVSIPQCGSSVTQTLLHTHDKRFDGQDDTADDGVEADDSEYAKTVKVADQRLSKIYLAVCHLQEG